MIALSCSHAPTCPLFPLLQNSLASWRTAYCDDDVAWAGCARHKRSMQGKPVPLALLPNGHIPVASFGAEAAATEHLLADGGQVSTVATASPVLVEDSPTVAPVAPAVPVGTGAAAGVATSAPAPTWWQRLRAWLGGAA